jgi:hypothetical protein
VKPGDVATVDLPIGDRTTTSRTGALDVYQVGTDRFARVRIVVRGWNALLRKGKESLPAADDDPDPR